MTSFPIEEDDSRLVVTLFTEDELATIDDTPVTVSAEKGIQARMGEDEDGHKRLAELHFLRSADWTREAVESFLADNGLDASDGSQGFSISYSGRPFFVRATLEADEADIEETEDFWIVKDTVVTQDGVYNSLLRPAEVIEDNWRLFEGSPITHGHPEDIVKSLDEVAGITENAELDRLDHDDHDVSVRVVADQKFAKHTDVDGLRTTEELVEKNGETVQRLEDGDAVDVSQGYVLTARPEEGEVNGDEYTAVAEEWIPNHVATLLDTEGACTWEDGCGLARLALDCALGSQFQDGTCFPSPPDPSPGEGDGADPSHEPQPGDPTMTESCEGDCNAATKLDQLQAEQERARAALDQTAEKAGIELDDELSLGAAADKVATHLDTELEDLEDYRQDEQQAKQSLAETCADHRIELGADEDERDELVTHYLDEYGSVPALREHAALLADRAGVDEEAEADTASRRVNGAGGDGEPEHDASSPGPGIPEEPTWRGA